MLHAENEWDYDTAARIGTVVDNYEGRADNVSTLLHLRWQMRMLMQHVKMVHLTAAELVALIAILAPVGHRPIIHEWDYGVRDRVDDAARVDVDTSLRGVLRLRCELRELMESVKLTDLSVPELVAILAIITTANGRRLLAATVGKVLRPILTLVDDVADLGDATTELIDDLAGTIAG